MSNTKESNTGIGFTGLLLILFIGLKLTGYIAWSWWWVLSPVWIWCIVIAMIIALITYGSKQLCLEQLMQVY